LFKSTNAFCIIILLFSKIYSGHPICIDGLFEDWDNVPLAYQDSNNDHLNADYSTLKITYDSEFLFIYLKFYENEFLMQNWNEFHLYIDADNNLNTGFNTLGIGAELIWCFGERSGFQYMNGQETEIYQNDLKLRIAPTVTSNEFEIAIDRESFPLNMNNTQQMIQGKIICSEFEAIQEIGDFIPNEIGGVQFTIYEDSVLDPQIISLERINESDLRIISYNTLNEGILDSERQNHYKRILQALKPDIIALQEHGEWDEIHDVIQSWFPQQEWYSSWTYRDLIILSRFPIINDASLISSGRTMVALLDTDSELGKNLLVFNSHLSCCDNDEDRQEQVDEFSGVWRDWVKNESGPFELEFGTPFVHLGDFNYVGYSQQISTIINGDIVNEDEYGDDFLPDWDSTGIIDLFSRHTHKRMGYTWRNDGSSFNPGKLDYIFYSDASIDTGKHYILNTLTMNQDDLENYNLNINDTKMASDHLPLVFDILVDDNVGIKKSDELPSSFYVYNNYPNPFNPTTQIDYNLPEDKYVNVIIYNVKGKRVKTLVNKIQALGFHSLRWDARNDIGEKVSAGVYIYKIQTGKYKATKKMVLLK